MSNVQGFWTQRWVVVLVVLALLILVIGVWGYRSQAQPSPVHHVVAHCIAVDPQDEPPAQDYDAHNCPGVK
jgi:RsiW-degrading membrane proteinase PrsW (M82 family)